MTNYLANSAKVRDSILDGILSGNEIVKIKLAKKDDSKKLILNFQTLFIFQKVFSIYSA